MPVSFIVHKGKKILYIDYSGIKKREEMIANLHEAVRQYKQTPENLRTLINVTDAAASKEWMAESKKYGKDLSGQTIKGAIIGVTGVKKILLQAYNAVSQGSLKPFESKDEALDYLAEH